MSDPHAIKVMLRSPDGRYVAGHEAGWLLTDDSTRARVFDFVGDRIAEQLQNLQRSSGATWVAVPVDPREGYEICDGCGQRLMAFKIFFDGERFLCPECRPPLCRRV
jgi:hypothetical protein